MWKDIQGWENLYEVSTDGNVRNKRNGNLIFGDVNNAGYRRIQLYAKNHNPEKERVFIHRLVATHFIPNPNSLPEVNHIDGNKLNNSIENLEWISRMDNELHCRQNGLKEYKPYVVSFNNGEQRTFDTTGQLARVLNVTRATVKFWLHGHNTGYLTRGIDSIHYL